MRKPKLSICMIVRNEAANLQRCLDSFLPIIQMKDDKTLKPLTELIIVDTGSTDNTVNIAKKFTKKVYEEKFIPWNFSKARNSAIEKATGDKIMIVDADEELRQQSLYFLEDTILNPKYTEPAVFVKLHNFYTQDRKQYAEMLQPRIAIRDGFHYEGSVHNKPMIKSPYLFAPHIIFNHYGYMFQGEKGEKLFEDKKKRSLPMLIREYKKNPGNLHNLTHLVKTYYVVRDFENTITYGEMWAKAMRKVDFHDGWWSFLEVFNNIIGAYLAKNDVKNAERIEREACRYSNRIPGIYLMLGSYFAGKDNEKTKEYFEIALDICKTKGSVYEDLLVSNVKMVLPEIINWLAIYYFEVGDDKKAGERMNEGIILNGTGRSALRWDIWNASEQAKKRLIKGTDNQPYFDGLDILKVK